MKKIIFIITTCLIISLLNVTLYAEINNLKFNENTFLVGTGIYDITGPCVGIAFMGMSDGTQIGEGLQSRLYSRAYVIADINDSNKRLVFVSTDLGMIFQSVKIEVVKRLRIKYGNLYSDENVLLTSTHTHAGPAGYSYSFMYNTVIGGYVDQNFQVIVDGICRSIELAGKELVPAEIYLNQGDLYNCGWNRSPGAYENNPEEEKVKYGYDEYNYLGFTPEGSRWNNTNKNMTLLKFVALNGKELGVISWFGVHATSMGQWTKLVSSDNKGYAEYLLEKEKKTDYNSNNTFLASFPVSTAGDVTPQLLWGSPITRTYSEDFKHCKIVGYMQYKKAKELMECADKKLKCSIDCRNIYVDFSNVQLSNGHRTYPAALGFSMSCGSTECSISPVNLYNEGMTKDIIDKYDDVAKLRHAVLSSFFLNIFSIISKEMTDDYIAGHGVKPIAVPNGLMYINNAVISPNVLPVQLVRLGNFVILATPMEITTMSGRRLCNTVLSEMTGLADSAVIAANSNAYAGYLATYEEYQMQNYEGASTHFGPYTLEALQDRFAYLAKSMKSGEKINSILYPEDLSSKKFIYPFVIPYDEAPLFTKFGMMETEPKVCYKRGDTIKVAFYGAHPANDLRIQDTYLRVEKKIDNRWITIAQDRDFSTKMVWRRVGAHGSIITVEWDSEDSKAGIYRISHFGSYKPSLSNEIKPYNGCSREFCLE